MPLRFNAGIGGASACAGFQCNFKVPLADFNDGPGLVSRPLIEGGGGTLLKAGNGGGAGGTPKKFLVKYNPKIAVTKINTNHYIVLLIVLHVREQLEQFLP